MRSICSRRRIVSAVLALPIVILLPAFAAGSLNGTQLSLRTLAQATSSSEPVYTSFERTVLVTEESVEFPDVGSLFNPETTPPVGFLDSLVNVAIDARANSLEIDFDHAGFGTFAFGFENTYVFRFESAALISITGAAVDPSVTTLGITNDSLRFAGNELFVKVAGLPFNSATFARINLTVVPEASCAVLSLLGVAITLGTRVTRRP
jgi:hypothetical protein